MEAVPRIIEVTQLENGIIVGFADGHTAIYSQALLWEMLPRAEKIIVEEDE